MAVDLDAADRDVERKQKRQRSEEPIEDGPRTLLRLAAAAIDVVDRGIFFSTRTARLAAISWTRSDSSGSGDIPANKER